MRYKSYILLSVLLLITAFKYGKEHNFSGTTLTITEKRFDTSNVLCINVNITSKDYIDSLKIIPSAQKSEQNTVFVFDSKTKRTTVEYYVKSQDKNSFKLKFIIYKDDKKYIFEKKLKIKR